MILRRTFLTFLIALNLFLTYKIIFSEQGIYAYRDQKVRFEGVREQLQASEDKSLGLSQEIRWLNTDRTYTEQVIRTEMNFLKESEILYLFPENRRVN
jgi:cell division protein FtsB/cell division protein DivIC